jgi:shikimate kinase
LVRSIGVEGVERRWERVRIAILYGGRGTGKSVIGEMLADRLGYVHRRIDCSIALDVRRIT